VLGYKEIILKMLDFCL